MFTKNISGLSRALVLAVLLAFALNNRSNAGDNIEMSPAEYKRTQATLGHWLSLVDKNKYPESFAAASDSFRKDSTAEKWAANHAKMLADLGPVVSRGEISNFTSNEKPSHEKASSSYQVDFKTKFKKKTGKERLEIVKENGEWKVADYTIIPDNK